MNQLQIINNNGQRVLTTSQLAEAYGTDIQIVVNNFNRNKDRYSEGKHFVLLTGEYLREFRAKNQIDLLPNINRLYLWTEKGAWLHAKSLNTDQAWDAYEKLVDDYYTIKENVVPLSKDQALVTVLRTTADLVEDTQAIKEEQHEIRKLVTQIDNKVEEQITLDHGEQRRLQKGVATKVYEICNDPKERPKFFKEIYREIKDRFGVASYKDVKRKELQSALRYIENWIPRKVS
ncbi:ORF6N domain-containing protein [Metabacillus litoralis]|uniref:ORF6N domain-containing protein n=1 Tax=Metabacillus litoralis TaxID=152268 RepID=UPI00203C31B7|nr:ORF6N domain-containing protein [Metabacillus litoralis]MCM3651291.1 ORF6C domain-containing protein [Metabacillus litoralis]